jgi:hypothetical protein
LSFYSGHEVYYTSITIQRRLLLPLSYHYFSDILYSLLLPSSYYSYYRWEEFKKAFQGIVYTKTKESYADLLDEFKTKLFYNNGKPHRAPANITLEQEQEIINQDLKQKAVVYVIRQ